MFTQIALELQDRDYKPCIVPLVTGLPHEIPNGQNYALEESEAWAEIVIKNCRNINVSEVSNTNENPEAYQAENRNFHNHLICNFSIGLSSNSSSAVCFDYRRSVIRFLKRGEEIDSVSFESVVGVVVDSAWLSSTAIFPMVLPHIPNSSELNLLSLKDLGVHDYERIDIKNIKTAQAKIKPVLEDSIVSYFYSNIDERDKVASFSDSKILGEEFKHLRISIHCNSRAPISFVCSSTSQRDHLFHRLQGINRETYKSLRNTTEMELVLHRVLAKRPTQSGMFFKNCFLVIIPGRLLVFDSMIPEPLPLAMKTLESQSYLTNTVDSALLPHVLTHSNICPKDVITLFNSQAPEYDGNCTVKLCTFNPEAVDHEYRFTSMEDAGRFLNALCLSRDLWEYQHNLGKVAIRQAADEDAKSSHPMKVATSDEIARVKALIKESLMKEAKEAAAKNINKSNNEGSNDRLISSVPAPESKHISLTPHSAAFAMTPRTFVGNFPPPAEKSNLLALPTDAKRVAYTPRTQADMMTPRTFNRAYPPPMESAGQSFVGTKPIAPPSMMRPSFQNAAPASNNESIPSILEQSNSNPYYRVDTAGVSADNQRINHFHKHFLSLAKDMKDSNAPKFPLRTEPDGSANFSIAIVPDAGASAVKVSRLRAASTAVMTKLLDEISRLRPLLTEQLQKLRDENDFLMNHPTKA